MKWLWFIGPLVFIFVFVIISLVPSDEEKRLRAVISRWIRDYLGPLIGGKKKKRTSRRVRSVPAIFNEVLAQCGEGTRVTDVVLVPKLAYLAVRAADALTGSNQFTVVCKLAKHAPKLLCRPLPVVDGRPAPNAGLVFEGDPDFTDTFVVEAENESSIREWLTPSMREALLEFPEVWLRAAGRSMAITIYGAADADALDELVGTADALFAERGAAGGASLFGDEDAPLGEASYREEARQVKHASRPNKSAKRRQRAADSAALDEDLAPVPLRIWAGLVDLALYVAAAIMVAAVLGKFASFHPSVLFNSPDIEVTEAWQGGWTTKGFAAFVAAESALVGLFVYQAHLAASAGQSIGKRILGARVVRMNGDKVGFVTGVLLRSWLFGLVPLVVAAAMTRPFTVRAYLVNIPQWTTGLAAVAVVAVATVSFAFNAKRRGLHDQVSGTCVVTAERFRLSSVQLGVGALDPVVFGRLIKGVAILGGFVLLNLAIRYMEFGFLSDFGFWIY